MPRNKRTRISLNDASWLFADSQRTPMQVGMLARFSLPEDAPDSYVTDLVQRWRATTTYATPFNYRLQGRTNPKWELLPDEDIDLDYHLRHSALPGAGGERELGILISRLHSSKMDRHYPLWEVHVIEGLGDQQWALYVKAHHSQMDGVGGMRMMRRTMSADPTAHEMLPPWVVGTSGPDQSGVVRAEKSKPVATTHEKGPSVLKTATGVSRSLGRTYLESFTGTKDDLRAVPFRAPKTLLNGPIGRPRRFATQNYSMERMRAVGKAGGGSLNDVFLTICGGAVRRYLLELDALPSQSLTANVPVSVREEVGARVGNAVTFLYATMGTDVADPVERMRRIRASTQLGKERLPKVSRGAMDAYTTVLMMPVLSQALLGVGGFTRQSANIVISNVPGPDESRYIDGSRLESLHPVSLLFNGQGLNITAVSYAGQFNIGYTGCRDSVPHLQRIAVYSGEALDELEAALGLEKPSPEKPG